MADYWPLLDIRDAVQECESILADVVAEVVMLQADSDGQYPPDAAQLLANIGTLRELLRDLFPPALQQAIAAEQTVYEEEEARWEPSGY